VSSKIPITVGNCAHHEISSPTPRAYSVVRESPNPPQINYANIVPEATDVTILHSAFFNDVPPVDCDIECKSIPMGGEDCNIATPIVNDDLNGHQYVDETSYQPPNYGKPFSNFVSPMNHDDGYIENNEEISLSELVPLAPPGLQRKIS
jgi:hypothetical protein